MKGGLARARQPRRPRTMSGNDRGAPAVASVSETGEFAVSLCRFFFGEVLARRAGLPHEVDELRREQGGAEVKALVLVAAELGEECELLGRLDPFRDHLQVQ